MNDLSFERAPAINPAGPSASPVQQAANRPVANVRAPVVQLLAMLKRSKWILLGSMAIALIAGLVVTLLMTPLYTATATLEIQREGNRIVEVQGVQQESGPSDLEFYQTQYGLLKARSLAERTAANLRLYQDPAFFEMFGADDVAEEIRSAPRSASRSQRDERVRRAGDILIENVAITPTRMSRLVDVEFTSPDPALSAKIVNAWIADFVDMTLARRFEATSYARRFLENRLEQTRERLEQSERDLVRYAAEQGIVNIPTNTTNSSDVGQSTTERSLVAEDLATLNQALNAAIVDRTAAQSRLRGAGTNSTEALQSVSISSLRIRRAELAAEYARMLTQFEPQYPPAVALRSQLSELDKAIAREEGRVRSTITETYQAAQAREDALRERVKGLERSLVDQRGRNIQYNIYQREVDTNRQLYDALLQRYKEIGVAGGVGVNNISVVDNAEVPENPSSPRLLINLILALLAGTALGVALAFAREQIDEGISDPDDVENVIGMPLLGAIPKSENPPQEDLNDRKSAIVEAYLSAQTSLAFTTDHGIPRTLAVTSSKPAEGKSTSSYALARSLARTGRKVLLIDGDMRSPSVHEIVGIANGKGFSNYLAGENDTASLIHSEMLPGLSVMTAGPTPPNAAELLVGNRIGELAQALGTTYDSIIIDAPPVMGLADAPLIGSQVEGVVFVIESHATRVNVAKVAIGRLADAQARVLGVLLTKFENRRASYGYGHEYGYGYGETVTKAA